MQQDFKYDLAVSFAGEQRNIAESIASRLDASGYSVFYDEYHQADLWGRELAVALKEVYADLSRYCLILVSDEYLAKAWTDFERKNAISRFIKQRGEYVLCLKIDDVSLPGFPDSIAYVSWPELTIDDVYKLLLQKLGAPSSMSATSRLADHDRTIAQQVLEACFRRAIYTRMDSEIDPSTMYDSIGMAIGSLLKLTPQIKDQALQFTCNDIIAHLDAVERTRRNVREQISNFAPERIKREIDSHKQRVVQLLLEVRRVACIPMQLPTSLRLEHYYGIDQANDRPRMA